MDGQELGGFDGALLVDGFSNDVHDSSESLGADWHHDGVSSVGHTLSSNETFSRVQGDSSNVVSSKMLGNLENESVFGSLHLEGVQDWWEVSFELHINDGSNDLGDLSNGGRSAKPSYRKK